MGYKVAELGRIAREFLLLRRGPWPSEEALRYQQRFVADMQEMEARRLQVRGPWKSMRIHRSRASKTHKSIWSMTTWRSPSSWGPMTTRLLSTWWRRTSKPSSSFTAEPDSDQQNCDALTYHQEIQPQDSSHQGTPAATSLPTGPPALVRDRLDPRVIP